MRFGETQLHIDPGPGALVRALSVQPPCNPRELDALLLSHKHLDHSNDINIMIEAMTSGGFTKRGMLFAPQDALEGEPVVFPYAQRFVGAVQAVTERGGPYHINDVELRMSVKHVHAVETYGMHFTYAGTTVSYLPCGRSFEGLAEDYRAHAPDVLIVNVLRYRDGMDVDHLTFDQTREIFAHVRPRVAVMQHFGTKMLERGPDALARELEEDLNMRVIAAHDDMLLDVETELAANAR